MEPGDRTWGGASALADSSSGLALLTRVWGGASHHGADGLYVGGDGRGRESGLREAASWRGVDGHVDDDGGGGGQRGRTRLVERQVHRFRLVLGRALARRARLGLAAPRVGLHVGVGLVGTLVTDVGLKKKKKLLFDRNMVHFILETNTLFL